MIVAPCFGARSWALPAPENSEVRITLSPAASCAQGSRDTAVSVACRWAPRRAREQLVESLLAPSQRGRGRSVVPEGRPAGGAGVLASPTGPSRLRRRHLRTGSRAGLAEAGNRTALPWWRPTPGPRASLRPERNRRAQLWESLIDERGYGCPPRGADDFTLVVHCRLDCNDLGCPPLPMFKRHAKVPEEPDG